MRSYPDYKPITVEEFLSIDFGSDKKFELVDGEIKMMTGGTRGHSRVSVNILAFLRAALRGSGCRPHGPDMGIRLHDENLRYPDVSVFCGNSETEERDNDLVADDPVVIFEVLSPSTSKGDQGDKLNAYRAVPSLDAIVFVDPENELTRVIQRLGPTSWRDDLFSAPHDVALPRLGITIPHDEIFARD